MKSSRYWHKVPNPHKAQQSSANKAPCGGVLMLLLVLVLLVVVGPAVVGSRQKGTSGPGPKQKVVLSS